MGLCRRNYPIADHAIGTYRRSHTGIWLASRRDCQARRHLAVPCQCTCSRPLSSEPSPRHVACRMAYNRTLLLRSPWALRWFVYCPDDLSRSNAARSRSWSSRYVLRQRGCSLYPPSLRLRSISKNVSLSRAQSRTRSDYAEAKERCAIANLNIRTLVLCRPSPGLSCRRQGRGFARHEERRPRHKYSRCLWLPAYRLSSLASASYDNYTTLARLRHH